MGVCCSGRMVRISSLFFRIGRSFSISLLSAVSAVVSCNKLPWLVNVFLLLLMWYGIPPSFSVCFAEGSLLDLLTGSIGFSVLFFPLSYLVPVSSWSPWGEAGVHPRC